MNRIPLVLCSLLIAAAVIGAAAYYRYTHPLAVATTRPTTLAATLPDTQPTTAASKPQAARGPTTQLLDILRLADPKYPTTQRLATAVDIKYAARFTIDSPAFLDYISHLWVTRPDAPATFDFDKAGASETATHVVRDQVVFVLWTTTAVRSPTGRSKGSKWSPHLIVKAVPPLTGYVLVDETGRRALRDPFGFHWERALVLQGRHRDDPDHIVVPTDRGACAFAFDDAPEKILQGHKILGEPKDRTVPGDGRATQLVMDVSGVIAYLTSANGATGIKTKNGVARFAAAPPTQNSALSTQDSPLTYKWTTLTDWPDHLLHLVPLLDGSVLEILSVPGQEKDKVAFSVNSVAPVKIDPKVIDQLIDQLSNDDPQKRDAAFKQLTTYGAGIAPILERALDEQTPEAQIRIRQLLKNKVAPSLGSMSLVDGRMRVVNRLPDGGVIFYAEGGVSVPSGDDTPTYITPAWLAVRPGRAVELLPPGLVTDLQPDKQRVIAWADNYVVEDPVRGPQWYIGNHLEPLLRKQHQDYKHFVGIDATGRWVFRIANNVARAATVPATKPSTQDSALSAQDSFLIIDPWLPDPTPRLPVWDLPISIGKVGWDKNDWPVIYMDAKPRPVPWALEEGDWRVIDEEKEKVLTGPPPPPAFVAPPASRPATTTASTSPTSAPTYAPVQPALLTTADGTRYLDGKSSLTVIRPDGRTIHWPLPENAVGTHDPVLLRTRENLLFLFNEPGRIVRIRPLGDSFSVEAVFTRGVPSGDWPLRIWLDPADRICIAHDQTQITVLFPLGRIPPAISAMMPAGTDNDQQN